MPKKPYKSFFWKTYNQGWLIFLFLAILIVLPFLIEEYFVYVLVYIFIGALLAQSFNMIFGYMGKLPFGHAAFFGLGAYVVAMFSTKTPVPLFISIPLAILISGLVGAIVGFFCVRRAGYYFAVLSMAFGELIHFIVFKWYGFTGGDDGIQGIPVPSVMDSIFFQYYFVLLIVTLAIWLMWRILHGPFGYTLKAIRDNVIRTEFNGVNVLRCQLVGFIIACAFAGLSGALFTPFNRAVAPALLSWGKVGEPLNSVIIGGQYVFFGPIVGAFIYQLLQAYILEYTIFWPFIMGIILIIIILFMQRGVLGLVVQTKLFRQMKRKSKFLNNDFSAEKT